MCLVLFTAVSLTLGKNKNRSSKQARKSIEKNVIELKMKRNGVRRYVNPANRFELQ